MKKIIFNIAIIISLMLPVNGFALSVGTLFEQQTEESNSSGSSSGFDNIGGNFFSQEESSPVLKVVGPGTGGTDPNPSAPIAEGGMLLFLMSVIHGIVKRKKK